MSAAALAVARAAPRCRASAPARVALLGTGTVGSAVLARLASWHGTPLGAALALVHVANSRQSASDRSGLAPRAKPCMRLTLAPQRSSLEAVEAALGGEGARIVIDATASEAVAERHAHWLAQGIHVATACKIGQGTSLSRWRAIRAAAAPAASATATAPPSAPGLPLLRSLRELQAGGDRIHAIAGVLSGSLAWLFNHYDGMRPFSALVRQARDAGYTEPDPRDDLSGEDVRRKLLILARSGRRRTGAERGRGRPRWCRRNWRSCRRDALDAALPALDAPLRERYAERLQARRETALHRPPAGWPSRRVGLESLPADHPLAGGAGTDNRVAIWSDRYCTSRW